MDLTSRYSKNVYRRNAEIYNVLSNPLRLEILNSLVGRSLTVGELCEIVKIRNSNMSQHLAILRHYKLVKTERNGKFVKYSLFDPRIVEPCRILKEIFS